MKRIPLTLLSALSLLLCGVAAGLWVQSYRMGYTAAYQQAERGPTEWFTWTWSASLRPSCVYLERSGQPAWSFWVMMSDAQGKMHYEIEPSPPPTGWRWYSEPAGKRWDYGFARRTLKWEILRLAWASDDVANAGGSVRLLVVPLYGVVLSAAVAPLLWTRNFFRRRAAARGAAAGMCGRCGYDLRASPGRCPECGEAGESRDAGAGEAISLHHAAIQHCSPTVWSHWALATAIVTAAVLVLGTAALLTISSLTPPPGSQVLP